MFSLLPPRNLISVSRIVFGKSSGFSKFPQTFSAQMGHKNRVSVLPEHAIQLAKSELCTFHAFKIKNKPVYATQFHPELTASENKRRFLQYFDHYIKAIGQEESERILSSFQDSTESSYLLQRFKNLVAEQCLQ